MLSTKKNILIIFLTLATLLLSTFGLSLLFGIYNTFFILFSIITIILFFIYGIEIILIITGMYFLTKNVLLFSNSIGIINLPYIKYFDPNIYSYSLILICLVISIPIIIKSLCGFTMLIFIFISLVKGRNAENFNELSKKIAMSYDIAEIINKKYKETIIKITTIRGLSFDFFKIYKYKIFMCCYIITASFCFLLLKFDFNSYYYDENNGYCSNIGNTVRINKLDNNENIVHILSEDEYNNPHSIYTFNDIYSNRKYVYETNCERGLLKYNQERFYSIDDILKGLAPNNTKIMVYGIFENNNLLLNDEDNNQKLDVKFEDGKIMPNNKDKLALVLMEVIGDLKNKEFIAYEAFFIDDDEKSIIEAKRKLNKFMDK